MSGSEPPETLADAQQKEPPPPLVERAYEQRAEMKVRHAELKSVSERLDHVAPLSRAHKWGVQSQFLIGGVGGGIVGFIPFIASGPALVFVVVYVVVLVVALGVALLCKEAATDTAAERADSVLAIKEHIDTTLLTTETPRLQAPTGARRLGPGAPAASAQAQSPQPGSHAAG